MEGINKKNQEGKQDIIEAIFFHKLSFTRAGHRAGSKFFVSSHGQLGEDSELSLLYKESQGEGREPGKRKKFVMSGKGTLTLLCRQRKQSWKVSFDSPPVNPV